MLSSLDQEPRAVLCEVRILGPCEIALDGIPADVHRWPRKGASLVRMLVLSRDYRLPRDEVIDRLWPETSSEAGNSSLKNLIHRMRRISADHGLPVLLLLEHGHVMLNPACRWHVDVEELLARIGTTTEDVHNLERALAICRGEPLFEDRYDDWAAPHRLRLQQAQRDLTLRLASVYERAGAMREVIPLMEHSLAMDPLDEEALHTLILALATSGRQIEALRRYDAFAKRLSREIEATPSPETMGLIETIREQLANAEAGDIQYRPFFTAPTLYPLPQPVLTIPLLTLDFEPAPSEEDLIPVANSPERPAALRFALRLVAPLILLASIVTGLTLVWWPETSYGRQTPQGTVATYFRLLQNDRIDDAFALTSMTDTVLARRQFHQLFDSWGRQAHRVTLVHTDLRRHIATVVVELTTFDGNFFGGADHVNRRVVTLLQNGASWRIERPEVLTQ